MSNRIAVVALAGLVLFVGWSIAQQIFALKQNRSLTGDRPAFQERVRDSHRAPSDLAPSDLAQGEPGPSYGNSPVPVRASTLVPQPISVEMIPVSSELQKGWTRWRGPTGQGIGMGTGYVDTWSETEQVIWNVDVPGQGNSSPIVWGDQIFLSTGYDLGQRRSILCFRRSDGELLWEAFAPEATAEREVHWKNGHASGTPCTDGERVYAFLGAYGLLCVGLDGKTIWHRIPDVTAAYHGAACSPLLYKDRLILYQDQPGGSFVAAFSTRTGEPVWHTKRNSTVGWGSPVAIRAGDRDLVIVSSAWQVTAYDPDNGKHVWSCYGNSSEVIPTPVAGHGLLFCASGRSGPTLAIHPGGSGDVSETHVAWLARDGSPFVPSPLLHENYLYMVDETRREATCYEAQTGALMWRERLEAGSTGAPTGGRRRRGRSGFSASPVAVDDKVFFTNERGQTFVLRGGPEFQLLHVNSLNAPVLTSPALVDGRWYFRTDKQLICIGAKSDSQSTQASLSDA